MIDVEIQNEYELDETLLPALENALLATLAHEQFSADAATVSLLLTDDETLRSLNATYRGYDKTTDVLSFPDGERPMPEMPVYLGDIAISVPQAQRQAVEGGHSAEAELLLLVVHGTLHLMGHDHYDEDEKAAMWAAQAAVLMQLGSPITGPAGE